VPRLEDLMKQFMTGVAIGALVLGAATASFAGDTKNVATKKATPVKLTAAQMDQVVAGSNRQAGYDNNYIYQNGKTVSVGDNVDNNNKRSEPSQGNHIYDWNSN
jgi:hypothetical protein